MGRDNFASATSRHWQRLWDPSERSFANDLVLLSTAAAVQLMGILCDHLCLQATSTPSARMQSWLMHAHRSSKRCPGTIGELYFIILANINYVLCGHLAILFTRTDSCLRWVARALTGVRTALFFIGTSICMMCSIVFVRAVHCLGHEPLATNRPANVSRLDWPPEWVYQPPYIRLTDTCSRHRWSIFQWLYCQPAKVWLRILANRARTCPAHSAQTKPPQRLNMCHEGK